MEATRLERDLEWILASPWGRGALPLKNTNGGGELRNCRTNKSLQEGLLFWDCPLLSVRSV